MALFDNTSGGTPSITSTTSEVSSGNPLFDKVVNSARNFREKVKEGKVSEAFGDVAQDQQELKEEYDAGPLTDQDSEDDSGSGGFGLGGSGGIVPTFSTGDALDVQDAVNGAFEGAEQAAQDSVNNVMFPGMGAFGDLLAQLPRKGVDVGKDVVPGIGSGSGSGSGSTGLLTKVFVGGVILVSLPKILEIAGSMVKQK